MVDRNNTTQLIAFNADVSDEIALAEGDEAADHIVSGGHMIDYLKVARALKVGQRIAVEQAGTDQGKPYNVAFSKWLDQHPKLRAVNKPNRAAALWCLDPANWPRVEKHLATLDSEERQTITLRTVRRRLDTWTPQPSATRPTASAPQPAPARRPQDRVQEQADRAEVDTLKKEVWRLRDKFDQLSMYLAEKPPPKAENRPTSSRYWPLPEILPLERRPKDVAPRQIVEPGADVTGDPAFALRREEFEQWLIRRKEALEAKYQLREDELKKAFDAKVREKVEAQLAREDRPGRIGEFRRLATKLATYFHTDKRERMNDQDWDRAFSEFMSLRNLIIPPKSKGKKGKATSPVTPDPAPEPPQEERPPAGALS
jgi:hypothetical protein